jgi:hypothetical protein
VETEPNRFYWSASNLNSSWHRVILVCVVAILSYCAAKLGGMLTSGPQTDWPRDPPTMVPFEAKIDSKHASRRAAARRQMSLPRGNKHDRIRGLTKRLRNELKFESASRESLCEFR